MLPTFIASVVFDNVREVTDDESELSDLSPSSKTLKRFLHENNAVRRIIVAAAAAACFKWLFK
jgi:hypothetical protein